MKHRSVTNPKISGFACIGAFVVLVGGILLFQMEVANLCRTYQFVSNSVSATGEILEKERVTPNSYDLMFYFTDATGIAHTQKCIVGRRNRLSVGKKVPVLYLPTAPDHARLKGFHFLWWSPIVFSGLGLVCIVFSVIVLWMANWGSRVQGSYGKRLGEVK